MAELTQKERLQPSLLDRLTDDEPHQQQESREKRVLSMNKLRQSVLRDMSWLLNARSLDTVVDLTHYPEVANSVLNYGIKDLSGTSASGSDVAAIERSLQQAIKNFEPRILPQSLSINVVADEGKMNHQAMVFDIEGDLWAQPLPLHLYLRSEMDTLTGDFKIQDIDS